MRICPKKWLRKVLPGLFVSLCLLATFTPNPAKAAEDIPVPLSISAVSQDYALLPALSRTDARLLAARPNKNDNRRLATYPVSASPANGSFISDPYGVSYHPTSSEAIFKRQLHQACQLLDIPPPSDTV